MVGPAIFTLRERALSAVAVGDGSRSSIHIQSLSYTIRTRITIVKNGARLGRENIKPAWGLAAPH